ncbi:MAG: hypothetical protein ACYS9X_07195, partial [Planctomycetota bacterium]
MASGVTSGLARGLVGWWKFDETTGAIARDSSDRGNDGKLVGAPKRTAGRTGAALEFDGKGSHVTAADSRDITGTNPRSVSAWIRTVDPEAAIASWGADEAGRKYVFRVQATDGPAGVIRVEVNSGRMVGSTVVA